MLQDVEAKRMTEVDIFAGKVIALGKKHNVSTPYNQVFFDIIKGIQSSYL
jgi:2-dehydropantoate 2-reductase